MLSCLLKAGLYGSVAGLGKSRSAVMGIVRLASGRNAAPEAASSSSDKMLLVIKT